MDIELNCNAESSLDYKCLSEVAPKRWTAGLRFLIGCICLLFLYLSHTPFRLLTYFLAVAAMAGLWRHPLAPKYLIQVIAEGMLLGSVACWLVTQCFAGAVAEYNGPIHMMCCIIFSSQTVGTALSLWFTRRWSIQVAAPIVAMISTLAELAHAVTFGITWITTSAALAVAATPIAQWSELLTPFGLCAVVVWIGCLFCPDWTSTGWKRWSCTTFAIGATAFLWLGGWIIESRVAIKPLSFSSMLVQPHHDNKLPTHEPAWKTLHQLTLGSLQQHSVPDLILWPEGVLSGGGIDGLAGAPPDEATERDVNSLSLNRFLAELLPQYATNCLVGTSVSAQGNVLISGALYPALCNYNCGCVFPQSGQADCHEKIALMPVRETVPDWFSWFPKLRQWILFGSNLVSRFQPGRNFHSLTFGDYHGTTRQIAVAICYESWLPWLPQYHCNEPLDAICHLAYDGDFKDHPEYTQRMLLTIRLRAIESRTWQLVCSHFAGTAVIDPRGRIVKQLPPGPGVLRTDRLE